MMLLWTISCSCGQESAEAGMQGTTVQPFDTVHHGIRFIPSGFEHTAFIDGKSYRIVADTSHYLFVIQGSDTSVLCGMQGIFLRGVDVVDFNLDGDSDVVVPFVSQDPGQQEVYLFDRSKMNFTHLENALEYSASGPLIGTPYYVSYNSMGCSDYNWESRLFGIKENRAYSIGHMEARQYLGVDFPAILVYRETDVQQGGRVDSLPGDTTASFFREKRAFIENYWRKNYKRFLSDPE